MKVYFTGSVSAGREYVLNYQKIVATLKKMSHKVLSEHVADRALSEKGEDLEPKEIFEREKRRIEKADAVLAEVTNPSTGVGMLVSYALEQNKKVLALFYQESEDRLSSMIKGNPHHFLYFEHYNFDNLRLVLKKFFQHVEIDKKRKGKFIVIEGGNASGKKTQSELLANRLSKLGLKVKLLDFPQYYSSFHGKIVSRYLNGEFGSVYEVNPYLISLAYALDRTSAKEEMEEALKRGTILVSNRYVSSNMALQSAKVPLPKRDKFLQWIDELEYRKHKMPREDMVFYLHVPVEKSLQLLPKRGQKRYLKKGKKDVEEGNVKFLKEAEKMYLKLARERKDWVIIDCLNQKGKMRSIPGIHREIMKILKRKKIL